MKSVNVGIDLGTTYSAVAVFDQSTGKVDILKNDVGEEITPSVVYMEDGEVLIGREAKEQQEAGNVNTAAFYKSMMGDENFVRTFNGKSYDAEGLSSVFLANLKKAVEQANNVQVAGAVITVPAYFNEPQRQATIHAGEKAGLKVLKIINEPTAAIIAYGLTGGGSKTVMVYDLGGGTFDVTIAKISGGQVEVIATNGDHQLGGRNWDRVLVDDVVDRFNDEFGIDIASNKEDFTELVVKCEKLKKQLTSVAAATINVRSEGFSGHYTFTREEFEEKTRRLMAQTILLTESCFEEIGGGFGWNSLDEVVLVGGSTRMPQVFETIKAKLGKAPMTIGGRVDTIVAAGAAMQAHLCVAGSLTLGAGSGMGAAKFGGQASGGAPSGASLTISNSSIQDVTSHSLGMLAFAKDGKDIINSIIIRKNSKVGAPFGKHYSFKGDKLEAYVLQGESTSPYNCTLLYKYLITGMRKGEDNKLTVNFQYNMNGVVDVTAQMDGGKALKVDKSTVTEDIADLIARLLKEKAEAEKRAQNARAEVTFAIDTSGSMSVGGRINQAKNSIAEFAQKLDGKVPLTLISFDNTCHMYCCHEKSASNVISASNSLVATGGTDADPIEFYENNVSAIEKNRILIVLTDGEWFRQADAIRSADRVKRNGTTIYAIGVADADKAFLEKIASKGGAKKIDLSKLVDAFMEIAGAIATEEDYGSSLG